MLLSMDRVLQLLAEGKSLDKIAELADVDPGDVAAVVEDARQTLLKYEKPKAKKKVIIRKQDSPDTRVDPEIKSIMEGADLTAVPLEASLVIYTDGASRGNPGPAGVGIVILDEDDHQVGKVSRYLGKKTNNFAEYEAIVQALRIAGYFRAKKVRIRTDSELIVRQVLGEYQVKKEDLKSLYKKVMELMKAIPDCQIEHVSRNQNDKADYLAKKGSNSEGHDRTR
jgi:ribonuclease HI